MVAHFLILLSLVLTFQATHAANVCINDPDGSRGINNFAITKAVQSAQDPLMKSFLATSSCSAQSPKSKSMAALAKVAECAVGVEKIKAECIKASLQREVKNTGYTCNNGKPTSFENSGSNAACIDQKTLNFIQFSINNAISCMSPPEDPIDPRFILKKINNETGFNFFLGYPGGVGIGQLTSDPVNELAGWWQKKRIGNRKSKNAKVETTFNQGNAKYILENLSQNTNPSCAPFKKIVESDLASPPPSPGNKNNYCRWLSVGEGLGRNLVYGLGYYVYARDRFIKDTLQEKAPELIKNKEVVNSLTLVAYGPGGQAQAKALIRKLRLNNSSKPSAVVEKINAHSDYVAQTNEKLKELYDNLKTSAPHIVADPGGQSCITK